MLKTLSLYMYVCVCVCMCVLNEIIDLKTLLIFLLNEFFYFDWF